MQGSAWRPALLALARRIGLFANRSSKAHLGWLPPVGSTTSQYRLASPAHQNGFQLHVAQGHDERFSVRVARVLASLPAVIGEALHRLGVADRRMGLRYGACAGVLLCDALGAHAQELNPRAYVIAPTGLNAINLGYSHLDGSLDVDGAAPITSATASADLAALGYYRGLDFFGRSANFAVSIPYALGEFSGTVMEAPRRARRSGFLDASLRLSVNLIGGPAMEPKEFAQWRQDILLGVSLKIVAPTGQYDPTTLINWGTNRWAFKPEIGYSQRWDHWVLDGYLGAWFFTKNSEFFSHNQYFPGSQSQTQAPVTALEAHLSYDVKPRLWVSLDANFWVGGETSLNGMASSATYQRASRVGITASIPLTVQHSIKISFNQGAYIRYGGNYRVVTVTWQYGWR